MALQVDTSIPYGNACDISITAEKDAMTEVAFAPDPHRGPECLWFCFRLAQTGRGKAPGRVRLVLKHSYNVLGGSNLPCIRPVFRYAEGDWERLGAGRVEDLPDGRNRIAWMIKAPESFVDMAYCYPYGRPEVDALIRETNGYWQADVIGVSQEARPLVRLSNGYGEPGSARPGLYLVARQHSGETPGSWVLDGFLRYIAALERDGPLVWAVPLANIDGVEGGDYGKDGFPYDLNRAWGVPPMRHEVLVFQRDIQRWMERCRPGLAIDFHAPGACEMDGIYCHLAAPAGYPQIYQEGLAWSTAIESALTRRYAAVMFDRLPGYASRWETPRFSAYCWERQGICGICVETPYAMIGDLVLTRQHYQRAGARIAEGVIRKLAAG